jgi:hypothetical protein
MNEFPEKENIINLTKEELNDIYTLIDKTTIVVLKNLCKKYKLKCSLIKVQALKIFLKEFFKEQHEGKFEFTERGLKEKKVSELKKIIEEYGIEIDVKDKKDALIKKIITHLKKSRSRSRSKSRSKSPSKTKSPISKKRISINHKFKNNDRVYVHDMEEYGKIVDYDNESGQYTVFLEESKLEVEFEEDMLKHSKSPKVENNIYSAETEYPEIKPLTTGYSNETIPAYDEVENDEMPGLDPPSDDEMPGLDPPSDDEMPALDPPSDTFAENETEYI